MAELNLESEVTGTVWKILVKKGDTVEAEQPVLIVESMKMEIPVEATHAGTVKEVCVAEQDPVEEGQVVAIIAAN